MRALFLASVTFTTLAVAVQPVVAWDLTAGELTLTMDREARLTAMAVGGRAVPMSPSPFVALCDVESGQYVAARVTGGTPQAGLQLDFGSAGAQATLTAAAKGGALHFTCDLQGADLPARGMLLRFAVPVTATGWQWHDDMQTARKIEAGALYENVVPLRAFADLPEWADQPALRMGLASRNFCTVITGPVGLCLAVPLDSPRIFRTAYDAAAGRLELVYDFALTPDSRHPNRASFSFDLYACDPAWGLRGALQRYYALYPEAFTVHVREQGQWMAFNRLSEIDNANEFCFALQEGAPEPEYDDKIGVLSATYFTHAGMGANIPDYDPEQDPLPPYDVQVAAMEAAFKRTTGQDGIYERVGLWNAEGRLDVQKWSVYAHLIAQFTLDPELPYGEWTLRRAMTSLESIRQRGGELDGFYYDGLSTGVDYNPAHFRTADATVLWDPANRKPYLNNFFSSCKFAKAAAELLRPLGKITMMNGAIGSSYYVAPWLDVLGAETGLRIPREDFNYIRTIIHHKPFLTLLKGNYEQSIGRPEMELFMKRCLAYGVYPGFFDWPPSGLGPGGQYWNHAKYYERDRDIFRKYQPLCRQLALAGWEPTTRARSSNPSVFVERFGPKQGVLWFTLLNEEQRAQTTTLSIDLRPFGLKPAEVSVVDLVSGATVPLQTEGDGVKAELAIPADGVMALQLARPQDAAQWRVAMALETLDRGELMRRVDAEKPAVPTHWRPAGRVRRGAGGESDALVLETDDATESRVWQWVMLFQSDPAELKLRVRAAAENLPDGAATIRCQPAWVTSSYAHYEDVRFPLPGGTWDWRDLEFTISDPHALRAVQVFVNLGKAAAGARLSIASLSLTDAEGKEYVTDGRFRQWYEPIPPDLRPVVTQEMAGLRGILTDLASSRSPLDSDATHQALASAFGRCEQLRAAIRQAGAENGCRRVLRDLETIEGHLSAVTLSAYGLTLPVIGAPLAICPGDDVALSFAPPAVPGLTTRTEVSSEQATVTEEQGRWRLRCPADLQPGQEIRLEGRMLIGPPGAAAVVRTSRTVAVVAPLEVRLASQGFDQETGAARVRVSLRNNRHRPGEIRLAVQAPEGWRPEPGAPLEVAAGAVAVADVALTPQAKAEAGSLEVSVRATMGQDAAQDRIVMLYLPPEANLLANPGFESGTDGWSVLTKGEIGADQQIRRSGRASLLINNPAPLQSQVSQSVTLNQAAPCAVLVQAAARGEDVTGAPDSGFSLYVDIYYTDGTPRYGITHDFQTGTTDWQLGELYIEPEKPIRNVNVYLLLRGKAGKAWFDDVSVVEDPRRKGNIAGLADVSVDSSYTGYDATPITDGVIAGEGLHWTKEAWASADKPGEHFVVFAFPDAVTIAAGTIYWSLDAGVPHTSRRLEFQVGEGDQWRTVATIEGAEPVPQSAFRLAEPVTGRLFRLLQPRGQGPADRPDLLWLREVELYAPR
ncbi:MAG: hypothetical protein HPY69_04755 [Armatimonadetes bacterium]|nr:hypothetical protein [Armatimonadota bacterium]